MSTTTSDPRLAGLLEGAEKEATPLQKELDRIGKRLSVIMLGICALVFMAGLLSTPTFTLNIVLGLFLFAVALAVAAIPEALPAIVTVGLSLGVRRMAAAHAIVRKLPGSGIKSMFDAGMAEVRRTQDLGLYTMRDARDHTMQRVQSAMQTRQNEHLEDLGSSMTFLASIGANAPFIGLFGTVWGIMVAFVGIAKT